MNSSINSSRLMTRHVVNAFNHSYNSEFIEYISKNKNFNTCQAIHKGIIHELEINLIPKFEFDIDESETLSIHDSFSKEIYKPKIIDFFKNTDPQIIRKFLAKYFGRTFGTSNVALWVINYLKNYKQDFNIGKNSKWLNLYVSCIVDNIIYSNYIQAYQYSLDLISNKLIESRGLDNISTISTPIISRKRSRPEPGTKETACET